MRSILLIWLLLASSSFAAEPIYQSEFSTGQYQDNQFNDEKLEIPNAYALIVTITGEIENKWDVLTLYNAGGDKIGTFTGVINERLEVAGSSIRVVFDADNRKHDFPGVTVKIQAQSFPQLHQKLKQAIQTAIKQLLENNTGEAAYLIQQHLKQLTQLDNQVRQAKNVQQVVKPVADELLNIAQTYRQIANKLPIIQKNHQQTLAQLKKLQSNTMAYHTMAQENVAALKAKIQTATEGWKKDNLQRVADLLHTQQTLWIQFHQQQASIAIQAKAYSDKILDFLSFLNVTAQIYEGTAHLALVQQSSLNDLQNMMDLSRLRALVGDIQQHEAQIKTLLTQIEQHS